MNRVLALIIAALCIVCSPARAIDLSTCMDNHYGAGNWSQRTGPGVGTDIQPALSDCLRAFKADNKKSGTVHVGSGVWLLNTPVPGADLSGNYLIGEGSMASQIVYNNANGAAFTWSAAGGYTGGGMKGIALELETGLGHTNAIGIYVGGDAVFQPAQMEFQDIYMTAIAGASYWLNGIQIDGRLKTTGAVGVRVGTMNNVQIFNCTNVSLYMVNAIQWTLINVGAYTGFGSGGDIYIVGAGAPGSNSAQIWGLGVVAPSGTMRFFNSSAVWINGSQID